ncbi:MAG: PilZ domain-containing protein [Planctomycetota bacterium]
MPEEHRLEQSGSPSPTQRQTRPTRPAQGPAEQRAAERRKRTGAHFLLKLDAEGQPVEAQSTNLLDLSESGCGLIQVDAVSPGVCFGIVLMRGGRWEAHRGEVVHCSDFDGRWHRLGIRFVGMDAGTSQLFLGYMQQTFGFTTGVPGAA